MKQTDAQKKAQKKYYKKNRAKLKASFRRYYLKNKGKYYEEKYGITLETFNLMFQEQKGCCAICGTHQSELKHTLHVDHDHISGKVRCLLCGLCNKMLGLAKDNPKTLIVAAQYLKGWAE